MLLAALHSLQHCVAVGEAAGHAHVQVHAAHIIVASLMPSVPRTSV